MLARLIRATEATQPRQQQEVRTWPLASDITYVHAWVDFWRDADWF